MAAEAFDEVQALQADINNSSEQAKALQELHAFQPVDVGTVDLPGKDHKDSELPRELQKAVAQEATESLNGGEALKNRSSSLKSQGKDICLTLCILPLL